MSGEHHTFSSGLFFVFNGVLLNRYSGLEESQFTKLHAGIKRGDIVGVEGFPG